MASDFDDYVPWQFRASAIGINGSHRSEHPQPAPRVVVERSGGKQDAGRPVRATNGEATNEQGRERDGGEEVAQVEVQSALGASLLGPGDQDGDVLAVDGLCEEQRVRVVLPDSRQDVHGTSVQLRTAPRAGARGEGGHARLRREAVRESGSPADRHAAGQRVRHDGEGPRANGAVSKASRVDRQRAYEPGRLARAVQRPVKKIGPRQYAVKGNVEKVYFVDLDQDPPCHCMDRQMRNMRCLHELSALLQERDPAIVAALVERYERQLKRLRDAGLLDEGE